MSHGFVRMARTGIWATYTPTWSTTGTPPSLGNGTVTGRYLQRGKTVEATVQWLAGTTTTYGTGNFGFTLPVAARLPSGSFLPIGTAYGENSGSQGYNGFAAVNQATGTMFLFTPGTANAWTNVTPFSWGDTDFIRIAVSYEAA